MIVLLPVLVVLLVAALMLYLNKDLFDGDDY